MADEDDGFQFALSMYLRAGDPDDHSALPLDIAQAAGRQAAESGFAIRVNPFDFQSEGPHHFAWMVGYESTGVTP